MMHRFPVWLHFDLSVADQQRSAQIKCHVHYIPITMFFFSLKIVSILYQTSADPDKRRIHWSWAVFVSIPIWVSRRYIIPLVATIGPSAKRNSNGVSLAGQQWPVFIEKTWYRYVSLMLNEWFYICFHWKVQPNVDDVDCKIYWRQDKTSHPKVMVNIF